MFSLKLTTSLNGREVPLDRLGHELRKELEREVEEASLGEIRSKVADIRDPETGAGVKVSISGRNPLQFKLSGSEEAIRLATERLS